MARSNRLVIYSLSILILGIAGNLSLEPRKGEGAAGLELTLGPSAAHAAPRNVARRTARRTTRRVVRRTSVAGCSPYRAYYNCGGVYYAPVVEGGVTVYVVVNP